MGITMNTSTEKIKAELVEKLEPLFGKNIHKSKVDTIQKVIDHYVKSKQKEFYRKDPVNIGGLMVEWISGLTASSEDSRAEVIFHDLLTKAGIAFKFQYKIGPFRADFLIADFLVFEIDGPTHYTTKDYDRGRDKYIKRMGYEIMHIPLTMLMISPEAVIEDINKIIGDKS